MDDDALHYLRLFFHYIHNRVQLFIHFDINVQGLNFVRSVGEKQKFTAH